MSKIETSGKFISTDTTKSFTPFNPDTDVFEAKLGISSKQIKRTRKVYQLLDMLGDIGGFFDAVFMIFELLMSYYAPGLFF